ncbi:cation diffusion facilitator family transporter [Fundidesulfovibrio agrisoli]|uniref:cation diffusion facilitator family transporter n=1 Tax=Fundidesulfovibrio agrisoli TaxID=2922717 RepID=UPI001FAC955A|nr:cation diffusion facilitator family transporter [Fundidesulfovibrio agrisoli]
MHHSHTHDHPHDHGHGHCCGHSRAHEQDARAERLTWLAFGLNAAGMAAEVVYGLISGSMALFADGLHMASDAFALGIALFAYAFARRNAHNGAYAFGAGKINSLAGFASAVLMACVTAYLAWESAARLFSPVPIDFGPALVVAVIGLGVNAVCALFLHGHAHANAHDHNIRAAYLHLLADALTSLFAIGALLGAKHLGLHWLDPLGGLIGALVIGRWSLRLIQECSRVLLDRVPDPELPAVMRARLEQEEGSRVRDIKLWRVSHHQLASVITVEDESPRPPEHYKRLLAGIEGLDIVTVEVHPCPCPMEA